MQDRIRVGAIDTPHCLVSKQINSHLETLEAIRVKPSVIEVLDLEVHYDDSEIHLAYQTINKIVKRFKNLKFCW